MQLTVNIEDKDLNDLITQGVKGLSEETLTDLAKEALMNYLTSKEGLEAILYGAPSRYYGESRELRSYITKMLTESFTKGEVEQYRQKLFQTMENDFDKLMSDTLAKVFVNMFCTNEFQTELYSNMYRMINEVKQQ